MKKIGIGLLGLFVFGFMLAACTSTEGEEVGETETLQIVTTFSVISDMVLQVGGDLVEVTTLTPIGEDPHEHEVLPADIMAVEHADMTLYNGMNLETGYDWFDMLMEAAGQVAGVDFMAVTEGITALYLTTEGLEAYQDPHAWLDINNGMIYIQNIADILSDLAPDHEMAFQTNAATEIARLESLRDEWLDRFTRIPEDERLVTTVEGAFRYFGLVFGIHTAYLWEINAHEEGTPEQFMRLIGVINDSHVRHLFVESVFDGEGYMEQVSEETGLDIYAVVYTDSLSEPGGHAPTYFDMLRHNLEVIYSGLTAE
ncbi:MAG: zinc ABC transporter substrate-binding protein [Defluviitaleaceae bacterium]|nr:zinc ABC transporter substrate-binding protein [Defluviitaleaceae bacterium]